MAAEPAARTARARQAQDIADGKLTLEDLPQQIEELKVPTACKQWNTSGTIGPLSDQAPYGKTPNDAWLNRIRTYEVGDTPNRKTVHMPMPCMHCEDAACVTVCPTGASYKRAFLTGEFRYQVAANKLMLLRRAVLLCGFLAPLLLNVLVQETNAIALAYLAALIAFGGILTERWLFFAEARHVVRLYHGEQRT